MINQPLTKEQLVYTDDECGVWYKKPEGDGFDREMLFADDVRAAVEGLMAVKCDYSSCITQDINNEEYCFDCSRILLWFPVFKNKEETQ